MNPVRQAFAIVLLLASAASHASLVLNRSIVIYDEPDVRVRDVLVRNAAEDDYLFLDVNVQGVVRPGSNDEALVPLDDLEPDFIASPNRIALAPREDSLVRLLNIGRDPDRERVYRINVTPVAPPMEFGGVEHSQSRLRVMVAYQVLVVVLPEAPVATVEVSRDGRDVVFTNGGNANYLLTNGFQCNPAAPDECVELTSRRIYGETRWHARLPFDGPFRYTVRTHDAIGERVFD